MDEKKLKNIKWASLVLMIVFLGLYFWHFRGFGFSINSSDWANFSTFLSLAIAVINLLIFYILTIELHKFNLKKRLEEIRPIISFHLKDGNPYYTVENIGNGVALDLKIKRNYKDENWQDGYNYFTLSPGEKIFLKWSSMSLELAAEYKDKDQNQFYSYMDGNYLRFFNDSDEKENHKTEYEKAKKLVAGEYKIPEIQ